MAESGAEFAVTFLQSGLRWAFEDASTSTLLVSDQYDPTFQSLSAWSLMDSSFSVEESGTCTFECSSSFLPTSLPTAQPTTLAPTAVTDEPTMPVFEFLVENHINGKDSLNVDEQGAWKSTIIQMFPGATGIEIASMGEFTDPRVRRSLAVPDLNVTAWVSFNDAQQYESYASSLSSPTDQENYNQILNIYFMFNPVLSGKPGLTSEFIGLAGSFEGNYFQPSAQPTFVPSTAPSSAPTKFVKPPQPTMMPTTSLPSAAPTLPGTTIVIVIDGVDPNDEDLPDDITNVTDTVTGTDTEVIDIIDNGDGTTTVVVSCRTCTQDDPTVVTEIEAGLNDEEGGSMNVLSIDATTANAGGAKNGGDIDMQPVVERSVEWMIIAISVMCFLVVYYCFVNRNSVFNTITCTQQEKIIEVPEGAYKFDIAQPADISEDIFMEKAFVHGISESSVCTAYSGVLVLEGNRSFETAPFPLAVDEGEETRVMPANVHEADGYAETGAAPECDGDVETGNVSDVAPRGEQHYSRPSVEVTSAIGETYVSRFNVMDTGSPSVSASAVEYVNAWGGVYPESPTASPTACATPKRAPLSQGVHAMFTRQASAGSIGTASTADSVASQDLSGFAALSPKRHVGHSQIASRPQAYNGPKRSVKAMTSYSQQSLDSHYCFE